MRLSPRTAYERALDRTRVIYRRSNEVSHYLTRIACARVLAREKASVSRIETSRTRIMINELITTHAARARTGERASEQRCYRD